MSAALLKQGNQRITSKHTQDVSTATQPVLALLPSLAGRMSAAEDAEQQRRRLEAHEASEASSVLDETEAFLQPRSQRLLQSFCNTAFLPLLNRLYGVRSASDSSHSWLQLASHPGSSLDPARLLRFLHPTSPLLSCLRAADRMGHHIRFLFPISQLPPGSASLLLDRATVASLGERLPYHGCTLPSSAHNSEPSLSLSSYTFFVFWLAPHAVRLQLHDAKPDASGRSRPRSPASLCCEVAALHLDYFLPPTLSGSESRPARRDVMLNEDGASALSATYSSNGSATLEGVAIVSILSEFWLQRDAQQEIIPCPSRLFAAHTLVCYVVHAYAKAMERNDMQAAALRQALMEMQWRLYNFLESTFDSFPPDVSADRLESLVQLWETFLFPWNVYEPEALLNALHRLKCGRRQRQSAALDQLQSLSAETRNALSRQPNAYDWRQQYAYEFSHFYITLFRRFVMLSARRVHNDVDGGATRALRRVMKAMSPPRLRKYSEIFVALTANGETGALLDDESLRALATIHVVARVRSSLL